MEPDPEVLESERERYFPGFSPTTATAIVKLGMRVNNPGVVNVENDITIPINYIVGVQFLTEPIRYLKVWGYIKR